MIGIVIKIGGLAIRMSISLKMQAFTNNINLDYFFATNQAVFPVKSNGNIPQYLVRMKERV